MYGSVIFVTSFLVPENYEYNSMLLTRIWPNQWHDLPLPILFLSVACFSLSFTLTLQSPHSIMFANTGRPWQYSEAFQLPDCETNLILFSWELTSITFLIIAFSYQPNVANSAKYSKNHINVLMPTVVAVIPALVAVWILYLPSSVGRSTKIQTRTDPGICNFLETAVQ